MATCLASSSVRCFSQSTNLHPQTTLTPRLRAASTRPPRKTLQCRSFFNGLFGSKGSEAADDPVDPREDWSQENLDEVVLVEVTPLGSTSGRIVYRNGGVVDAVALEVLCDKVGWPRRDPHKVDAALANSFLVATLTFEEEGAAEGAPGRLVGLARCTSDGAFNATIWDVLVDPELQGQGLGKALVGQIVRTLLAREITNITLFADAKVVEFYTQLGFEADPSNIRGMFWLPQI